MNCHGGAKIKDVLDYLLNEDGLYKYIKGACNPKKGKPDKKAIEFLHLKVLTNLQDENGNRLEITLNPELSLDQVKKYFFDFVDLKAEKKSMPLYYCLKDPEISLKRTRE